MRASGRHGLSPYHETAFHRLERSHQDKGCRRPARLESPHLNLCLHPPFPENPKKLLGCTLLAVDSGGLFTRRARPGAVLFPFFLLSIRAFLHAPESSSRRPDVRAGFSAVGGVAPSQTPKAARTFVQAAFSFFAGLLRPFPGMKAREQGKYGDGKGTRRKAASLRRYFFFFLDLPPPRRFSTPLMILSPMDSSPLDSNSRSSSS